MLECPMAKPIKWLIGLQVGKKPSMFKETGEPLRNGRGSPCKCL
jgi:hypothetical protein